jgi:CheY-like chemotaxis protein
VNSDIPANPFWRATLDRSPPGGIGVSFIKLKARKSPPTSSTPGGDLMKVGDQPPGRLGRQSFERKAVALCVGSTIIALILASLLDPLGVDLTLVENGRQAVEAFCTRGFDVVLMDIQMPVLDGVHATSEIRLIEAERSAPRTPIVAVSADAMTDQVEAYLAVGFDAHVAKPIVVENLFGTLAKVTAPGASRPKAA